MLPQVLAATPVVQVMVQVIAVLLEPLTKPLKSCVRLVMTLADVGEIEIVTLEEFPDPQPSVPSAAARATIVENFHQLIPILPNFLNIRPLSACAGLRRLSENSLSKSHIHNPVRKIRDQNVLLTVNRNVRTGSKKFVFCGLLNKFIICGAT